MSRAGIVGLAGRPNVGKSTLVNALAGAKVTITSDRPQTTRRAVRAVVTDLERDHQVILADLPGVQRPRDALTARMQRRVEHELADADAVLLVCDGDAGVGPGDRFIASVLLGAAAPPRPVLCAVNKCDRLGRPRTVAALAAAAELEAVDEVFPVSAKRGTGLAPLLDRLGELMPEGPPLYPLDQRADTQLETMVGELIREQALRRTRQEVPHALEVHVEELSGVGGPLARIAAELWVDSDAQRKILIGRRGQMVRSIGTAARKELERHLGTRVFLDLAVRSRRGWRADEAMLDRLGID